MEDGKISLRPGWQTNIKELWQKNKQTFNIANLLNIISILTNYKK